MRLSVPLCSNCERVVRPQLRTEWDGKLVGGKQQLTEASVRYFEFTPQQVCFLVPSRCFLLFLSFRLCAGYSCSKWFPASTGAVVKRGRWHGELGRFDEKHRKCPLAEQQGIRLENTVPLFERLGKVIQMSVGRQTETREMLVQSKDGPKCEEGDSTGKFDLVQSRGPSRLSIDLG